MLCNHRKKPDKGLGLFLLLVSVFLFFAFINYSCWGDLVPQHFLYALTFSIFAAGLHFYPHWIFVNFLTKAIGKISFSLYLSHFMILNWFKFHFHGRFLFQGDLATEVAFLIVLGASMAISAIMYFAIEKPGINLGKYLISKL
jgi:peptidoglycan/LPS O-acetylase OafA/YrhL